MKISGLYAVIGLLFTFVSIIWFFLPALYRGWSPILAAIVVVILTTLVTMYLVGGFTAKATVSFIGAWMIANRRRDIS